MHVCQTTHYPTASEYYLYLNFDKLFGSLHVFLSFLGVCSIVPDSGFDTALDCDRDFGVRERAAGLREEHSRNGGLPKRTLPANETIYCQTHERYLALNHYVQG